MGEPGLPLIQCDVCGTVTPARFNPTPRDPEGVSEARRETQLSREGWRLSDKRDTCPRCTRDEERLANRLDQPCPHCSAQPGLPCVTSRGLERDAPHARRG